MAVVTHRDAMDDNGKILAHLLGQTVQRVQVLGINSLKTITPRLDDLVGQRIESTEFNDRILTVHCTDYSVVFDLQRTGRVAWTDSTEPARVGARGMPTARVITGGGAADLIEPGKTKRITVTVRDRRS